MIHEIHDGPGLPVRHCDRCGAVLVTAARCPSHAPEGLQERLEEMRLHHLPLTQRALEVLRSLGATPILRICDLAICSPDEAAHALTRLARRGLANRVIPGTWAPGAPPTGEAIVVRSPSHARTVAAQIRARRVA